MSAPDRDEHRARPGGMGLEDLELFNRELSGLAGAGVPLEPGLRRLARSAGRTDRRMQDLADLLESGVSLPDALDQVKVRAPRWYQVVVAAGIRAGDLGGVLDGLSTHIARQVRIRRRVVEALWYPALVVCLAVGFVAFAAVWIHPRLAATQRMLRARDAPGPAPADPAMVQVMSWLSHVLGSPWFWVAVAAVVVVGVWTWVMLRGSVRGDRFAWRVPMVGPLLKARALMRFFELLGVLVKHGVPVGEAVALAGDGSGSPCLADQAGHVRGELDAGMALPLALTGYPAFRGFSAWAAGHAERQGHLAEGLAELADMYAREADDHAHTIIMVTPPLTVLVAAGLVGALYILGLWAPLIGLLETLLELQ